MILFLEILFCLCFWLIIDAILLEILHEEANLILAEILIPANLYDDSSVNWFGAWFLSILANIIGLPFAICFWIYQLCTIERE